MTTFGCVNNTIRCISGVHFDLANPRAEDVRLEDIATGLSHICRYGGHVPDFFSVAEHSIACALLGRDGGHSDHICRAALLHDAAESYIGDCVKPLKVMLPEYSVIESAIEDAIAEAFGIEWDYDTATVVRRIDMISLKREKIAFFPDDGHMWTGFDSVPHVPFRPMFMSPVNARHAFLEMAHSLGVSHT